MSVHVDLQHLTNTYSICFESRVRVSSPAPLLQISNLGVLRALILNDAPLRTRFEAQDHSLDEFASQIVQGDSFELAVG